MWREFQTSKTLFWTRVYKGEKFEKKNNSFLACARTSNRQKLSSTDLIKDKVIRPLRKNSSKTTLEEKITLFKQRLHHRDNPDNLIDKTLSEVNFCERMSAPRTKQTKNEQKHFSACVC